MKAQQVLINRLSIVLFLLSAVANFTPNPAYSDTQTSTTTAQQPKSLFDMSLDEVLGIEVSTASKLGGRADMAPANMMVITQEEIRRFGYRTLSEALDRAVGFSNNDLGFLSSTGFRGIKDPSAASNSRILFLIDGLRYNERGYDTAFINETFPLDIESIDRIEILKGAGSAIWGTNALYGVVNVVSKNSASDRNKQVMAEYASNNRGKGYVSYGDKTEGGLKYFASASYMDSDGDLSVSYPHALEASSNNTIAEGDLERQSVKTSMRLEYEKFYFNTLYGISDTSMGTNVSYRSSSLGEDDYKLEPFRLEAGYTFDIWKEKKGELLARSFYTYDRYRLAYEYPGDEDSVSRESYRNWGQTIGAELRYSQNITEEVRFLVGAEVIPDYDSHFIGEGQTKASSGDIVPDSEYYTRLDFERTDRSYFFDVSYSPIEELSIFLGGRVDSPTGLSTAFGPRASIVGQPVEGTILKLLYSQGFRNPTLGESQTGEGFPEAPDPEELNFYEFLIEQRVSDWGSVVASVFYNELTDFIDIAEIRDIDTFYGNFDGVRSKGVELSANANFNNSVKGYLNLSFAEGRNIATQSDIENISAFQARSGFSFRYEDYLIASPEVIFGSSTKTNQGFRYSSYWISNLTLISAPVSDGAEISASLYNIFDNDYYKLSDGRDDVAKAMESGREFRLQGTWRF